MAVDGSGRWWLLSVGWVGVGFGRVDWNGTLDMGVIDGYARIGDRRMIGALWIFAFIPTDALGLELA